MINKNFTLLFLLSSFLGFAQIPIGYYDTATGTGYALKTQLSQIIDNNTNSSGTANYGGLWTLYTQPSMRDNYYENNGTLLDIYSENPDGADAYEYMTTSQQCASDSPTAEGSCYNREHIVPQSVFGGSDSYPMYSDAHFVLPSDNRVNNWRSNYPFGVVVSSADVPCTNTTAGNASTTPCFTTNGSRLGQNTNSGYASGYSGIVFEPIDEFKGDVARTVLYFATRYETQVASWSFSMFNGTSTQVLTNTFLEIMKQWHQLDPVSPYEIAKNNEVYLFQGNRNPYIDNPEYVNMVWNLAPDTEIPTTPTNLTVTGTTSTTVSLSWTASTDNVGVASYEIYVDGILKDNSTTTTKTIFGLTPSTNYSFYLIAKDFEGNVSPASTNVNGTTSTVNTGGCTVSTTEDFENMGTNANNYTTRTWTNPTTSISWTATDARTDQTITTKAITIRNGNLTSSSVSNGIADLTVTTQLKFSGSSGTFKLRINGIDTGKIIPYSSTSTTTTIPSINIEDNVIISFTDNSTGTNRVAFDNLTWTCYEKNLGVNDYLTLEDFKIAPNPSNGDFNITFDSNSTHSIEIYSSIGKKVFEKINVKNDFISITNLSKGIYFAKIGKDYKSVVKKIVVN